MKEATVEVHIHGCKDTLTLGGGRPSLVCLAKYLGMRSLQLATALVAGLGCLWSSESVANEISFADKQIVMLQGYPAGGGVDLVGRIMAQLLPEFLPGRPSIVPRFMPGANGITQFNHFLHQVKGDGLSFTLGTSDQIDPYNYSQLSLRYDPGAVAYFGGVGRGGYALLMNRDREARLLDKSASPVIMGSIGAWPRAAMQVTLWGVKYLNWNVRWVTGYSGTNDVMLALERGEIDMTSTGNQEQVRSLLDSGKSRILIQTGSFEGGRLVGRGDFGRAPLLSDLIKPKLEDGLAREAFQYWEAINALDKILVLPPHTNPDIIKVYRNAFEKMSGDIRFQEMGKKVSDVFIPMPADDVASLAGNLASTRPAVLDFLRKLAAEQGLKSGN